MHNSAVFDVPIVFHVYVVVVVNDTILDKMLRSRRKRSGYEVFIICINVSQSLSQYI